MKIYKNKSLILIIVCVLALLWHLIDRFSYSKILKYYPFENKKDSILTIGIIGDSWVEGGKIDSVVHYSLLDYGIKNKVISSGQGGARSKYIYRNLYRENTYPYSSRFIIENNPDYCIVIGGTGDATAQVGKKYYSYHMMLIIKTLLHYNIKPFIVELPEIGINDFTDNLKLMTKIRTKVFACITNSGVIDNIQMFRGQLKESILSQKLNDSIIYLPYNDICVNYDKCPELYSDPIHLSKVGNIELGKAIANELILSLEKFSNK